MSSMANSKLREWWASHAGSFLGQALVEESLQRHTFYRIGGPAELMLLPAHRDDLDLVWRVLRETGAPLTLLGAGSNCLVSDQGIRGVVIKTSRLNPDFTVDARSGVLRAGCSVAVMGLLRKLAEQGWGGLEFLSGIPGTIGGAVRMNAGTHLGQTQDALLCFESMDLGSQELSEAWRTQTSDEAGMKYRSNPGLRPNEVCYSTEWKIRPGDPVEIRKSLEEVLQRRKSTQPLDKPSCGSVFKNPPGLQAWQVVDRLGLRGHRIGGAEISQVHSNWILNSDHACAQDVYGLIQLIRARAKTELGIELEPEVQFLGEMTS